MLEKSKKIFHFSRHGVCLNNHNSFKFEAFSTAADEKASKNIQTFHLKIFFCSLSVSRQYTQSLAKRTQFFGKEE